MRSGRDTVVFGTGEFPAAVVAALQRAAVPVAAAADGRRLRGQLKRAHQVILSCHQPAALPAWLDQLEHHGDRRRQQHIALGQGATPPPVLAEHEHAPRYIAVANSAARLLLNRWPLHYSVDVASGQAPHLLLLGFNRLLRAVLLQVMRLGHYGNTALTIDIACAAPQAAQQWFNEAWPQANRFCRVAFHGLNAHTALAGGAPSAAYVCLDDDQRTLDASRRLGAQLRQHGLDATPVYVLLNQSGAKISAGAGAGIGVEQWDGQRYPFAALDQVCHPQQLFSDVRDSLAHIIHDHYQDTVASQARDAATAPAGVPWDTLEESYRDASRHQSDHASAKLALARCSASSDAGPLPYTFSRDEVDRLARVEHDRWAADRYLNGWTYAAKRDNARKHHPDLVPYDALSQPTRDLDRFAVRLLPALLGRQALSVKPQLRVLLWLAATGIDRRAAHRLTERLFERLSERFATHQPLLLTRLAGRAECRIARRANEHYGVPLRVLFPTVAAAGSGDDPGTGSRRDVRRLSLLARAEARHAISDGTPSPDWLRAATDVVCADSASLTRLFGTSRDPACRIAELNPASGALHWHFDY